MKHDYDLSELKKIEVRGFDYQVMPRYLYHYTDKEYERFSLDLLDLLVTDGSTAIDIGAHYGIYSLLAARKAKKVYAFEPVPENFEVLKKNIAGNKLQRIITPINKAVSDADGEVEFNVTWASDSAGFYEHPNAEVIRKIRVKMAAVDHELKDVEDLSFIKIDTEGHEIHVLNGLRSTLRRNKAAKLLIEFNPECLTNAGTSSSELIKTIIGLGYDIFALHEDRRYMVRVHEGMADTAILQGLTYLNFLCLPVGSWRNILLLSHSSDLGGAERVLLETVKDLIRRTDTFTIPFVVLPGQGPLAEKIDALPVPMQIIHMRGWTGGDYMDDASRDEYRRMNSGAVTGLSQIFADFRPQLACTNTMVVPWVGLLAKAYDVPHIWSIHEFGDLDHGLRFDYGFENSLHYINQLSDVVVVNSQAVQKHIDAQISTDKLRLLHPHVEWPRANDVPSPYSKTATFKLAIVGRIAPSKGQFDAVKALHAIRKQGAQAELLLIGPVGSQDYWEEIERYCKQYDLSEYVHAAGFQDSPADLLEHANVALVCSSNEAYGMVTIEAMQLGKAVVGAASGGTPEIIEDGVTGLLYEPQNVQDLVEKIERLTEVDLRNKLGKAAQKAVKNLTSGSYTDAFVEYLSEAVQRHASLGGEQRIITDLLSGVHSQLMLAKQERDELAHSRNLEIQRFSEEYNKVYAAYNEVSRQLTHLEQTKIMRVRRKLGGVKRRLNKVKNRD